MPAFVANTPVFAKNWTYNIFGYYTVIRTSKGFIFVLVREANERTDTPNIGSITIVPLSQEGFKDFEGDISSDKIVTFS